MLFLPFCCPKRVVVLGVKWRDLLIFGPIRGVLLGVNLPFFLFRGPRRGVVLGANLRVFAVLGPSGGGLLGAGLPWRATWLWSNTFGRRVRQMATASSAHRVVAAARK